MPNDPQPTTGTGVLASAQNLVVPTRTETANAFANISELDPPDRSQHVAGSNIVLWLG